MLDRDVRRRRRFDGQSPDAASRWRPRTLLRPLRATLLPAGVVVLLSVPFAVAASRDGASDDADAARAAATGDVLREGRRNPSRSSAARETELIANIAANRGGSGAGKGGYVLRESNLSTTGGGPVHGCRAVRGNIDAAGFDASARDTKACIRVNNLSDGPNGGRAFEFAFGGPLGGLIEHPTGGDSVAPLATNATGVARGLNADRVDSLNASQIVDQSRAKAGLAAETADTAKTAETAKTADTAERANRAMHWVLVQPDGTIAAQSGGITVTKGGPGNYGVDFNTPTAGRLVIASSALANDIDFRGVVSAAPCTGGTPEAYPGQTCPGGNAPDKVEVFTDNPGETATEDHAFYVALM